MANESKRSKLERLKKSRSELMQQLAEISARKEMVGGLPDGTMKKFYSHRNDSHNRARYSMTSQMMNIQRKIMGIDAKLLKLQQKNI